MNELAAAAVGAALLSGGLALVLLLRRGSRADRFLAMALGAALLNILHVALVSPRHGAGDGLLLEPLQFALPPLFAAYVRSLLDPAWRPSWTWLGHLGPLLAMSLAGAALGLGPAGQRELPFGIEPGILSVAFWLLLLLQALPYLSASVRRIRSYRRALREAVSSLAGVDQGWLLRFSLCLHLLYLAYALVPALLLHSGDPGSARHLVGASLCAVVGILAAHQLLAKAPPVLAEQPELPAAKGPHGEAARPPRWDPLLPAALREAMDGRKLYRNPGLTLAELAEAVGWPRNEVSAAINGHFGQSFHDFVNSQRVAEAQRLMLDPDKRHLTLVALALEAGFNAKPTFNAVFKRLVGQTPSAWLAGR